MFKAYNHIFIIMINADSSNDFYASYWGIDVNEKVTSNT
ncbi:hypothetical protein DF16_orf03815 [Bacillus thuringiensis serovar kurstaki str. YBT-1520]|nr:hypothetical protein HD73_2434 [Bacillus thuringiensis serovar kurstaki str. HD73]AIM32230.1 hypothetical protein DF16_orf03815 [Bacillus thuringiensis serovar kurstaki str. YBT-1520]EEM50410.1 hypothetical protein bthur0006_52660 [Bacillus thuringiensis serovar kurstaki str. T03a001]KEH50599.1 hypothetical protein BG09_0664 [Bacillus thuringiensis serovar kurstaki str. HD-1]